MNYDELLDFIARLPPVEPPGPIRLTAWQWEAVKAGSIMTRDTAGREQFWGVPIELVTRVTESTPYLKGWILCPKCHSAIHGHNDLSCGWTPVVMDSGIYAVKVDDDAWSRTLVEMLTADEARSLDEVLRAVLDDRLKDRKDGE